MKASVKVRLARVCFSLVIALGVLAPFVFQPVSADPYLVPGTPTFPVIYRHRIIKGVALLDWSHKEDIAALGATKYYGWGPYCNGAANCYNMNRTWTLPQSTCYSTMLLGNEPTNDEPAGHPISASEAASVTVAIRAACPNTTLVVANIHVNNINREQEALDWLTAYFTAYEAMSGHYFGWYGPKDVLGLHCYSPSATTCTTRLDAAMDLMPSQSTKVWITEFGNVNYENLPSTLAGFDHDIRIAYVFPFTNRGTGPYLLDMVNSDGSLTDIGQIYADWTGLSVWQ